MSVFPPVDPESTDPYPFTLKITFETGEAASSYEVSVADFPLDEDNSPDAYAISALVETIRAVNPDAVPSITSIDPNSSYGYDYNESPQTIPATYTGTLTGYNDIYLALGIDPPWSE